MDGLGFDNPSKMTDPDESLAYTLARRLRKELAARRKLVADVNIHLWAEEMTKLLNQHEAEDVQAALAWFIDRLDKGGLIPNARSASGFRLKYRIIRECMQADQKVEITPQCTELLVYLRRLTWAAGSDSALPHVVQRSFDLYSPFFAKYTQHHSKDEMTEWLRARLLVTRKIDEPSSFILKWFEYVSVVVLRWYNWSGNLQPFIWTPQSRWFRQMGRSWSFDLFHDSTIFDKLMRELDANRKMG